MTGPNTALALMVRPSKPKRGASHILLEDISDGLFRGPAKAAQGIDLLVREAQAQCLAQDKALGCIPDVAVPHMLEGPDGATGLIVFDGTLVDALIEQQTLGRISAAPRVDRPVTAIDAALSSAFACAVVDKLSQIVTERPDASALAGFRVGNPQTDRAALSLALSGRAYDVLQLSVDLGPGVKTGRAMLMFPAAMPVAQVKRKTVNPAMVAILKESNIRLKASLPAIQLPVHTLLGLAPDTVIPLPDGILNRARLCDGHSTTLGQGRLGQLNGRRAVRLEMPEAPATAQVIAPDARPQISEQVQDGSDTPQGEVPHPDAATDIAGDLAPPEIADMANMADMAAAPV